MEIQGENCKTHWNKNDFSIHGLPYYSCVEQSIKYDHVICAPGSTLLGYELGCDFFWV